MPLFDIEVYPFMIVPSFIMMGIEAETQEEAEDIALNYYIEEAKRVKPVKTISVSSHSPTAGSACIAETGWKDE